MLVKFVEIDLMKAFQPIYVDARYDQLSVLVCWGYLPLGMLSVPCPANTRLFSAEWLRNESLRVFSWRLWEEVVSGNLDRLEILLESSLPPISVVVCTRDRSLSLERCLHALTRMDYHEYEVVVVDNCSCDASVSKIAARNGFRYVREDRPGLNWARNTGIQEAKYDIIAYIDDDALAAPGWLQGVALGFEDPDVMAVTGLILPAEIETRAQNDFELYGGMNKGFFDFEVRGEELSDRDLFWSSDWGAGANMAFRRTLFRLIGDFDVALDVGTPTNGGGDLEFFYRTVSAGHVLRYEPTAMVRHVHRRDRLSLRKQIYNNGRSFLCYLLTVISNEPKERLRVVLFMLRFWAWHWLIRRLIISLIRCDRKALRFSLIELWGSFSGVWAYMKSNEIALRLPKSE